MAKIALKAGIRLKSAVCDTQVMVIKAPGGESEMSCGGVEMLGPAAEHGQVPQLVTAQDGGTLIGKRYVNADESLELLCTKGGHGRISVDGSALEVKLAKQLPSSD